MKRTAILSATAVRYLKPGLFAPISPFELTEAIRDRYHFKDAPAVREVARSAAQSPVDFFYGKMEAAGRTITIEQLSVKYLGKRAVVLEASTRTSTDDAEAFLGDLLEWGKRRHGIDTDAVFAPTYRSLLQVIFERSISAAFGELQELGRTIMHLVQGYGPKDCPLFELAGISLEVGGPDAEDEPAPVRFFLERAATAPREENAYLAQAPLRTHDHERLLAELEKLLAGRRNVNVALMEE